MYIYTLSAIKLKEEKVNIVAHLTHYKIGLKGYPILQ